MIAAVLVGSMLAAQAGNTNGEQPAAAPALPVLTLEETLAQTQKSNNDLAVVRARLKQAKQGVAKAWSYYLPQVTAGGSYTHYANDVPVDFTPAFQGFVQMENGQLPAGQAPLPDVPNGAFLKDAPFIQKKNQWGGQIQVNQAILAPGLWFAISAAYAGDDAAESSSENARRQILFGAAQTYYGAASLKQAVTVQERQLAVTRDHERDAKVRYDAGTTPKVALLRAQIDRARAEQDLQRARNNYASAKVALATIVGRSGDFDVAVPVEPQPPSEDLPTLEQAALRDRPDVSAAAAQTKVADRSRNGTYMQYLPTIGAFGKYVGSNVTGFSGENWTWSLGLALNWNILDGGLREANIRENEAKVAEAEASQRSTDAKALQDVQQALLDYQSAQANKAKATEQLSLARENSKLIEVNYKAGAATYLEVADANSALLSAELGEVAETLNTQLAALRLEQAAGAFNPKG